MHVGTDLNILAHMRSRAFAYHDYHVPVRVEAHVNFARLAGTVTNVGKLPSQTNPRKAISTGCAFKWR